MERASFSRLTALAFGALAAALGAGMLGGGAAVAGPPAPSASPAAPPAVPAERLTAPAFEKFTLPNGLVVLLHEDPRAQRVAVQIMFRAGARDDPAGRRGMAHLVRNLLAKPSTRHLPKDDVDRLFSTLRLSPLNIYVTFNEDLTWIYASVPASALELTLWLESDRMGFLTDGVDVSAIKDARGDIAGNEDEAEGREGDPFSALLSEVYRAIWGEAYPYNSASQGMAELADVRTAEVHARLRSFYGPQNAVLVLDGALSAGRAREIVTRYFGPLVAAPRPARAPVAPLPLTAPRHIRREGSVDEPFVFVAWPTPPLYQDDDALLDEIATVLNRRLERRLIQGAGAARYFFARQQSREAGSVFCVSVALRPGHGVAEAIAAIDQELAELRATELREGEVRGVGLLRLLDVVHRLDLPDARAEDLGKAEIMLGDPGRIAAYQRAYVAATPAALRRVASAYLLPDRRVVAELVPRAPASKAAPAAGGAP